MLHLKKVVDDVSLQVVGTTRTITRSLNEAGIAFAEYFKDLRLPLSLSETEFVASSRELADSLKATWAAYGFGGMVMCRSLGTDATAGRRRRVATARKRCEGASTRAKRVIRLRVAGATRRFAKRAWPTPVALWGAAVAGSPMRSCWAGAKDLCHQGR